VEGTFKQILACFADRCVVVKPGFMAGATFGGMVTTFDYREITGIQVQTKMNTGYIEILTSSFQANTSKSYWSQGKSDSPDRLPNCIPIFRRDQEAQADKIQRLRDLVTEAKAVPAAKASPASPNDDLVSQLERLTALRSAGALSDSDFELAKSKLLGN
jgi:hypothetical protein